MSKAAGYILKMSRRPIHRFWRCPALPFVESRCANDSAACYAPHSHATLSLGAVDGGHSVFTRGGHQQRLSRGDVVLIPAGEVHSCNPVDDGLWSYQMLYLDETWVRHVVGEMSDCPESLDSFVLTELPAEAEPGQVHARLTRLNTCLFGHDPDEDKEAELLLFVGDLFGSAENRASGGKTKSVSKHLQDVQTMIEARCVESLSLDEMAATAGMSRYHLVRAFKRALGLTPHAWQLDLRIQRARKLLDDGLSLADTALSLGFSDQSHFQRAFKQRVAATPGEYQNYRRNFVQD